jgi:imidazolonepropionase-like amidohydrolase
MQASPTAPDRILVNCTVFDAARSEPLSDAGVWIKAGRIAAVGPVDDVCHEAGDVERIDLGGASLIPGLVNMHTHLSDAARPLPTDIPNVTLRMAANARGALQVGVTTVRCVAEPHGVDLVLRSAIAAGRAKGPRILTAGRAICCTGGHGSKSDGCLEADGADGVRQAVRSQIKLGVDLIKLMISGGIAGQHERVDTPQFTGDEMAAAL